MALRIAGATVDDPMPIWRAYARLYAGTIRGYDLRRPGDPNVLTPDEAWCSRIIGSRMTRSERDELVRRAAEPGCQGAMSGQTRTWRTPILSRPAVTSTTRQICTGTSHRPTGYAACESPSSTRSCT